ncbi:Gfo/Idh/MocA family protein [Streptomyces bauhiniae]|uniref:Gfo/Idh/MocA family protein n=1 Tax=Streptomyces bauhiniae TaxID=2340725 RepID=UPI0035DD7347
MTPPLTVLLIGAGTRTRKLYAPWLSGLLPYQGRPVRPLAVVDTDLDAARTVAAALPGAVAALPRDLDGLLSGHRPDLVVVATPDDAHRDYVLQALAAGCTTLVEKPLANTRQDAFALARAADVSPARLLVGHNLRFTNVHAHVRALLADGRIGTVTDADFHYTLNSSHARSYFTRWHRARAVSGGLEVTKASHHLDLLTWWLGSQPVAVTGLLERRHYRPGHDNVPADADIHDTLRALIQYSSGTTVHYTLTSNAAAEGYICTLYGTDGVLSIRYDARSGPHTLRLNTRSGDDRRLVGREDGTHAGADLRMLHALPPALTSATGPFATAAEAALSVAAGTAMYDSSRCGRRLPIPQPAISGGTR